MVLTINESLTTNVFVCLYYFFINRNTTNSVLQRKGVQELRNIVFLANTVNVSGEKMHLRILRRLIKKKGTWNFQSTHCFFLSQSIYNEYYTKTEQEVITSYFLRSTVLRFTVSWREKQTFNVIGNWNGFWFKEMNITPTFTPFKLFERVETLTSVVICWSRCF